MPRAPSWILLAVASGCGLRPYTSWTSGGSGSGGNTTLLTGHCAD